MDLAAYRPSPAMAGSLADSGGTQVILLRKPCTLNCFDMSYRFHHAICNEAFEKFAFVDACRAIRKAGYTGIEIAPFTLAEDPAMIPASKRREYRSIIETEGLRFVG